MDKNTQHLITMSCKLKMVIEHLTAKREDINSQLLSLMSVGQALSCSYGLVSKMGGNNTFTPTEKGKARIKDLQNKLLDQKLASYVPGKPYIKATLVKEGR